MNQKSEQQSPESRSEIDAVGNKKQVVFRYIADPMCAQCWGISPAIEKIVGFCEDKGIDFSLTMAGLRAGGGDAWDDSFKGFLRGEWAEISQVSGQTFNPSILARPEFEYDTEPACRAVVVAQQMLAEKSAKPSASFVFFQAAQKQFYVQGDDPKDVRSYRAACESVGLDFDSFALRFESEPAKRATLQQFVQSRPFGAKDLPALFLEVGGEVIPIATGFGQSHKVLHHIVSLLP